MRFVVLAHVARATLAAAPRFRAGRPSDLAPIAATLAKNLMNPLALDASRFEIVEDAGERVGWGQLKPLGPAGRADAYDARPGSAGGAEAVDAAWDELPAIPTGWASLPWTDEYREFARGAERRRATRDAREERATTLYELSSVFVLEGRRGEGLGASIVKRLLEKHRVAGGSAADVYLLTLATTTAWYEGLGFEVVPEDRDVPAPLEFEVTAGKAVTRLIGAELVVMRGVGSGVG